jgi:hypothetical protein
LAAAVLAGAGGGSLLHEATSSSAVKAKQATVSRYRELIMIWRSLS